MEKELSKSQKIALESDAKCIGVIAPAGSGKTTVIVNKLFNLIKSGFCEPEEILCVTYTRLSAFEMKKRLREKIGFKYRTPMYMGTIHACFLLELQRKENWEFLGYKKMPVLAERWQIIDIFSQIKKSYPNQMSKVYKMEELGRNIETYRNEKFFSENKKDLNFIPFITERYIEHLKEKNLIDYHCILENIFRLVLSNSLEGEKLRSRFKYVLVDECQDLDGISFEIIKKFFNSGSHVFMVGDPNQRIYEFRGAVENIFDELKKMSSDMDLFSLKENFRSGSEIVKLGNLVRYSNQYTESIPIKSNGKGTIEKDLWFEEFLRKIKNTKPIAILAETNKEFLSCLNIFIEDKIPFRISKLSLLNNEETKEITDIVKSVLFLNYQSFSWIFKKLKCYDLWTIFKKWFLLNINSISKGIIENVPKELLQFKAWEYIAFLIKKKEKEIIDVTNFLKEIYERGNVWFSKSEKAVFKTISSLINHVYNLECKNSLRKTITRLEEFLILDKEKLKDCSCYLGTIHSAKGLEWDNLGILNFHSLGKKEDGKCLKYVAVTRAKKNLFFT